MRDSLVLSRSRNALTHTRSDVEDTARVLESLADETTLKDAHILVGNKHENPMVAPDNLNSYWSADGLQRRDEQLALIREIVDALPKPDMIRHLYEVFTTRCQGPLLNVVHTPTFLEQAEELCFCLSCGNEQEQQVMMLWDKISVDTLAGHLLAVGVPQRSTSNQCSRSRSYSWFSRSPSIRPRQYMAGLLRIFLSRH